MGGSFVAQFNGECKACGGPIFAGDDAGYVDDEIRCWDCWLAARDEEDEYR